MEASAAKAAPSRGVEAVKVDNMTRDNIVVDAVEIDAPGAERGPEAETKGKRKRKQCAKAFHPEKRASYSYFMTQLKKA